MQQIVVGEEKRAIGFKGETKIDGKREHMEIGGWRGDTNNVMLTTINAIEIGTL